MIHILDSGPMIAFLTSEPGDIIVTQILTSNPGDCFAHVFNLTEVYYVFFRRGGQAAADNAIQVLLDAGIVAREDADTLFWKDAALFKGLHPLALPDGFCLALARRLGGILVTTDHAEFDPLVPQGYCPILFIR